MSIQRWSDNIQVVELGDDPQFTDDLAAVMDSLDKEPADVVLNFASVGFINSSNVARLLRLRKKMMNLKHRLVLCEANSQVWSVFLVTGLDKIFEFHDDIATALASIQLSSGKK